MHVSTSVQTVNAEKLKSFKATRKFLYCMEPELSLLYTILQNKIEILRSLKSGKTDFKDLNILIIITIFMISANCHQTRSHINCTQQQNKLYEDGQKVSPKDVGGINKHCATVGIGYCRCTAVVHKSYNIKSVCTLFSTGQRLYLS
jgi:hypothetical protein